MFMAKSSALAFIVVYIPSILVARYAIQRAAAYYVAMYLPHFVLIAVFGVRMISHLRKLLRGQDGPWTKHARRSSQDVTEGALLFPDAISSDSAPSLNHE
jgi:ABC-type transport system involved in cytochrome bd biosynthesis fused ATPase/permease subunit